MVVYQGVSVKKYVFLSSVLVVKKHSPHLLWVRGTMSGLLFLGLNQIARVSCYDYFLVGRYQYHLHL